MKTKFMEMAMRKAYTRRSPNPRKDQEGQAVDPIFYPDRTPEEVRRLRREVKRFFETAVKK